MKRLKEINWRAAWWATRWFSSTLGLIAAVAWFSAQTQFLLIAPAAILLAAIWYAFYRLRLAVQARAAAKSNGDIPRTTPLPGRRPEVPAQNMKRRFVYTDSETGEDVYKWEPA